MLLCTAAVASALVVPRRPPSAPAGRRLPRRECLKARKACFSGDAYGRTPMWAGAGAAPAAATATTSAVRPKRAAWSGGVYEAEGRTTAPPSAEEEAAAARMEAVAAFLATKPEIPRAGGLGVPSRRAYSGSSYPTGGAGGLVTDATVAEGQQAEVATRKGSEAEKAGGKHACTEPHPAKAGMLISKWKVAAENLIALGFLPDVTHPGRAGDLRRTRACADALTVMQGNSKLLMVAATAPDARAALGDVLSRTKVLFALSAGHGSAVASVSVWDDRWQVDHLVASPEVIDFGVAASAETGLMRHISEQAGELDIVLSDSARECLLSLDEKYSDSTTWEKHRV